MNGTTGITNSNLGVGVMEGQPSFGAGLFIQNPRQQVQTLIFRLQSLVQELNQYTKPGQFHRVPGYTPWSAPAYSNDYQHFGNPWNQMHSLSNLLGEIRSQIQSLEDVITKESYQSIQGTLQGLNLATQSLQTSQILRRMESIIEEIYRTVYQQNPGIS